MNIQTLIVGIEPGRDENADAVALGAQLARVLDTDLVLASVDERSSAPRAHTTNERALRRATAGLQDRLAGLRVESRVLPGVSVARALHHLADELGPAMVVIGSSPHAPWGQVDLGHVSERLMHGGGAPIALAPRGFAARGTELQSIAVGYVGTPESEDALQTGAELSERAGVPLRVVSVFDPSDELHWRSVRHDDRDMRAGALDALERGLASLHAGPVSGEMLDGEPSETLMHLSHGLDLLVLGSRSYGPLRAVLLGDVSRALVRHAGCAVMIVPHIPDAAHQVALVGGLEAPQFA